jgi:hypothetical protein
VTDLLDAILDRAVVRRSHLEADMTDPSRNAPRWVTWGLVLLGALFLVAAFVYFARPASQLPGFFPGHDPSLSRHHTTHGIGMLVLAALCGAGAWFSAGSPAPPTGT